MAVPAGCYNLPILLLLAAACLAQTSLPAATLRPATGLVVQATPGLKADEGQRYKGSLNPDPQARPKVQGKWEVLEQASDVVGVHLIHVPKTTAYLFMERPSAKRSRKGGQGILAGTFDLVTRKWTNVDTLDAPYCSGHAHSSDGQIIVVGGMSRQSGKNGKPSGMRSVRIFDYDANPTLLANRTHMPNNRWYPTVTLLADNRIHIIGGGLKAGGSGVGNAECELYSPNTMPSQYPLPSWPVEPAFASHMKRLYYPFTFVLPTGDLYHFGERRGRVVIAQTGHYRMNTEDGSPNMPLELLPGDDYTQFPTTATGVYSMLTPDNDYSSVDLMVFGGAKQAALHNKSTVAGRTVRRITISWTIGSNGKYVYSFSPWTTEDLGIPRCMGDGTLLPNGDVLLLSGVQEGAAGDSGKANFPSFWAQLYQPDKPINNRVSVLAGSSIARSYHSSAALTVDGTVMVAGCDRCGGLNSDIASYNAVQATKAKQTKFEYRLEIFYPPYYFDTENKPKIESVSGGSGPVTLSFNQDFQIRWSAASGSGSVPVTSVTLITPSATSHSINMNQRAVKLRIVSIDYGSGTLTVRSPPHPYIAPPQWYMLFIMNGKTMSSAHWVKMVDTRGEGKVVPLP